MLIVRTVPSSWVSKFNMSIKQWFDKSFLADEEYMLI